MSTAVPRPRLWWCNADFDLTLAHGGGKMPARILEAAGAMTWPLWPALSPGDFLVVPCPPPGGRHAPTAYRTYLEAMGLRVPRFVTDAEVARAVASPAARAAPATAAQGAGNGLTQDDDSRDAEISVDAGGEKGSESLARARFTPFGWNRAAVLRNAKMVEPVAHPPLDVVRHVNSRAFSLALERDRGDDMNAVFCGSGKAVDAWLSTARPGRYVAKGNHGLAGIGQLRFEIGTREQGDEDAVARAQAAALRKLAARHGGLVVEEELAVIREWGVLFRLGRDGRRSAVRRHRLLSGPAGGYAGALISHDVLDAESAGNTDNGAHPDGMWEAHRVEAMRAVDEAAHALRIAGYFGPVGLDMFVHEREGRQRLRPLVDVNARQSMAWPLHGLAARYPDRTLLFRQFPAKSLRQPDDYKDLGNMTGTLSFDVKSRRGAILLAPLLPFSRVSWAFIGRDEPDVFALQDELLASLAIPNPRRERPM